MDASVTIEVNPRKAVPEEPAKRVAWLERYGVLPYKETVSVTLPLRAWLDAGVPPDDDGEVRLADHSYPSERVKTYRALQTAIVRLIAETGKVPDTLPAPLAIAALRELAAEEERRKAAERVEREAEAERVRVEREAEEQRRKAKEAEKVALASVVRELRPNDPRLDPAACKETGSPFGFVDPAEVINIVEDAAFSGFDPYEPLDAAACPHDPDCESDDANGGPSFRAEDATSLTPAQMTAVQALRSRLPQDTQSTVRVHRVSHCGPKRLRLGLVVRFLYRGVRVSRELAVNCEDLID